MADLPGTVFPKYCSLLSELACSSWLFPPSSSLSLSCFVFILVYFSSFFSPYSFSHVSHFCFSSHSSPVPPLLRTPKGRTRPCLTSGHKRKQISTNSICILKNQIMVLKGTTCGKFSEKDIRSPTINELNRKRAGGMWTSPTIQSEVAQFPLLSMPLPYFTVFTVLINFWSNLILSLFYRLSSSEGHSSLRTGSPAVLLT